MFERDGGTLFSVEWTVSAFGIGLALQLLGWVVGIGFITGLPAYFLTGLFTAWGSPGNTLIEPGVAAFAIALVGFVIDHLLLTVLVIGIPLAVAYATAGLVIAVAGAFVGEYFLDTS